MSSIKSKIVFVTFALLIALSAVVISAATMAFYHDKELIISSNNASITAFEKQINTEIAALEKNALDLALMGEVYYKQGNPQKIGDFFTQEILKNYPSSMGNGLYFLPYKVFENQKIYCIHGVLEDDKQILLGEIEQAYLEKEIERMYDRLAKTGQETGIVSEKLAKLKKRKSNTYNAE